MDSEESACPKQRFRPNEGGSGRGSSSSVNVTSEKCVVCDLTGFNSIRLLERKDRLSRQDIHPSLRA